MAQDDPERIERFAFVCDKRAGDRSSARLCFAACGKCAEVADGGTVEASSYLGSDLGVARFCASGESLAVLDVADAEYADAKIFEVASGANGATADDAEASLELRGGANLPACIVFAASEWLAPRDEEGEPQVRWIVDTLTQGMAAAPESSLRKETSIAEDMRCQIRRAFLGVAICVFEAVPRSWWLHGGALREAAANFSVAMVPSYGDAAIRFPPGDEEEEEDASSRDLSQVKAWLHAPRCAVRTRAKDGDTWSCMGHGMFVHDVCKHTVGALACGRAVAMVCEYLSREGGAGSAMLEETVTRLARLKTGIALSSPPASTLVLLPEGFAQASLEEMCAIFARQAFAGLSFEECPVKLLRVVSDGQCGGVPMRGERKKLASVDKRLRTFIQSKAQQASDEAGAEVPTTADAVLWSSKGPTHLILRRDDEAEFFAPPLPKIVDKKVKMNGATKSMKPPMQPATAKAKFSKQQKAARATKLVTNAIPLDPECPPNENSSPTKTMRVDASVDASVARGVESDTGVVDPPAVAQKQKSRPKKAARSTPQNSDVSVLPLPSNSIAWSKYVMDWREGALVTCCGDLVERFGDHDGGDVEYDDAWGPYVNIEAAEMKRMGVGFVCACLESTGARALNSAEEARSPAALLALVTERLGDSKEAARCMDTTKKGIRSNLKLRKVLPVNENNVKTTFGAGHFFDCYMRQKDVFVESCVPDTANGKRRHIAVHHAAVYLDVMMQRIVDAAEQDETVHLDTELMAFVRDAAVGEWCQNGVAQAFGAGIGDDATSLGEERISIKIFVDAVEYYRKKSPRDNWVATFGRDVTLTDAVALWLYGECVYHYRTRFCAKDWVRDNDLLRGLPTMSVDVADTDTKRSILVALTWCMAVAHKLMKIVDSQTVASPVPPLRDSATRRETTEEPEADTEGRPTEPLRVLELLWDHQQNVQAAVTTWCRSALKGGSHDSVDVGAKRSVDDAMTAVLLSHDDVSREWKRFKMQ